MSNIFLLDIFINLVVNLFQDMNVVFTKKQEDTNNEQVCFRRVIRIIDEVIREMP